MRERPEDLGTRKWRLLVVEDDLDVIEAVVDILAGDADVLCAADGVQALEVLARGPLPHLVLTDLSMPRMDGLALTQQMRATERYAHIPVLVLTGSGSPGDAVACLNAGAQAYLTKPVNRDELLEKMAICVALDQSARA